MAVIFHHRKADHKRHFLVSVAMPYVYILCLCVGLLLVTLVSGALQLVGQESVDLLGRSWSLSGVSGLLLYLLGLGGEIFMLTSLYLVMPAGRMSLRHALLGGITRAAVGGHAADPDLVLLDAVAGERRLRLADHGDRGAAGARRSRPLWCCWVPR